MIQLRSFNESDKERLAELLNNPNVSQYTSDFIPYPYTLEDAENFLNKTRSPEGRYMNAVTLDGVLIGGGGLHPQAMNLRGNVEIGYWIAEPYWGKGYGREVVRLLIEKAKEIEGIHKIFARTFAGNIGSEKILQINGFVLEGTLKEHIIKREKFHDEHYWGLLLK